MRRAADFDPELFYKSREMPTVAYLRVCGFDAQAVYWDGGACWWAFDKTEVLLEKLDEYVAGEARVEPRSYYRAVEVTKRDIFESDPDPAPRPVRRH